MRRFWIILRKEIIQLATDAVGLILMFLMPLLLVFIITIIQSGAFKAISENKLDIAVTNNDEGEIGTILTSALERSKMFDIDYTDVTGEALKKYLVDQNKVIALEIPPNFTKMLNSKIQGVSDQVLGTSMDTSVIQEPMRPDDFIHFYYDPILQDNYVFSIENAVKTQLSVIQSQIILKNIYTAMGVEINADSIIGNMMQQKMPLTRESAQLTKGEILPQNATQHNVPAWTIFAMFFMVVSLGNNIVKEKNNGSFMRIRLAPTSFFTVMFAKMLTYLGVALLQIFLIFSVGIFVFPYIGMDALMLPNNILGFIVMCFLCSLLAVSFAMVIGAMANTSEQANGVGATLVVIFAAIGGIWVPVFVMPEFMQYISYFSPMRWCLEGFYLLFLHNASWQDLSGIMLFLIIFIVISQVITYIKLKVENLV